MRLRKGLLSDMSEIRRLNEQAARYGTLNHYNQAILDQWSGSFLDWYYPTVFTEHQEKSITFVMEENQKLIGVGRAIDNEIYFLFVDPEYHGQSIGSRILHELEKEITTNHKHFTVLSTLNAVSFYQKNGYKAIKPSGYDIGNDLWLECVEMTKTL